jgi:hypothetical protein
MAPNRALLTDAFSTPRMRRGKTRTLGATMHRPARLWLLSSFLLCLTACLPSTKATMQLGNGYAVTEMGRVEAVIEKAGFSRRVFDGPRATAHRIEKDGRIVSAFETQGSGKFGASVSWTRADGSLTVHVAESDTRFSPHGEELLQRLRQELQNIYGKRVTIDRPI